MRKKKEYAIKTTVSFLDLEKEINEYLKDGWELLGPPSPTGLGWLVTMVKYED